MSSRSDVRARLLGGTSGREGAPSRRRATSWSLGLMAALATATYLTGCGPLEEPEQPEPPELGTSGSTAVNRTRVPALPAPPKNVLAHQMALAAPPPGVRIDADGRLVCDKDGSEMVLVLETEFTMGSDGGGLDERPPHVVRVSAFLMDRHEVTNAQFAQFVAETAYVTDAEKGDGGYALHRDSWARGADWRHPLGPGSSFEGRESHPVVLVSWNDAQAYAQWAGRRLPTEAEFERCLRGGTEGATYPWGEQASPFPMYGNYGDDALKAAHPGAKIAGHTIKQYDDGFARTSPVGRFTQSRLGLFDVSGNVWEWCSDARTDTTRSTTRVPRAAIPRAHRPRRIVCRAVAVGTPGRINSGTRSVRRPPLSTGGTYSASGAQ